MQKILDEALAADPSIPGIIAAVDAPRAGLSWSGAAGIVARDDETPLTPAHAFRIASITKVYVAATALRLAEERRVDLSAAIGALISPGLRKELESSGYAVADITVAQLLAHTSGLRDYASSDAYRAAVLAQPQRRWKRIDQVRMAMALGAPLARPGARFGYSDTGYLVLAEIIERASGLKLHRAVATTLGFGPEGSRHTHFESLEAAPEGQLRAGQYLGELNLADIDPSMDLHGGGGLVSTADEMVSFIRALLQGRLFAHRETLAIALSTQQPTTGTGAGRALLLPEMTLGGESCWGHVGYWGTLLLYCLQLDAALALSINQAAAAPGLLADDGIAARLLRLVRQARRGDDRNGNKAS